MTRKLATRGLIIMAAAWIGMMISVVLRMPTVVAGFFMLAVMLYTPLAMVALIIVIRKETLEDREAVKRIEEKVRKEARSEE